MRKIRGGKKALTKSASPVIVAAKAGAPVAKTCEKTACAVAAAKVNKAQRVTFTVHADVGSKVFLAGCFNNWDPSAKEMTDKKGDGLFSVTVSLVPGEYQYKFVVNGTWCADPLNKDVVQNQLGTFNSIKRVTE